MKTLFIILLLSTKPAFGWGLLGQMSGVADVGSSCNTASDEQLNATGWAAHTDYSSEAAIASKVTLTSGDVITEYDIVMCDNGSGTGTIIVSLYDDDSDSPGSIISASSVTVDMGDLTDCGVDAFAHATVTLPSAYDSIPSTGTYWLAIVEDGGAQRTSTNDNITGDDRVCFGTTVDGITCYGNYAYDVEIWGCPP